MAGEIKRSGFSDPESINLTNTPPPAAPTNFQVESWGVQSTNPPDELPYIIFKWEAPLNYALTITDGLGDDVYTSGVEFATASGLYSTNDTAITLSTSASTSVLVGDRITIGTDTTRYIVGAISGTALTILYGLLSDVVASGASCKVLSKTANCPATYRLIKVDAADGDTVSFYAAYGTDYRLGWTAEVSTQEWEDLNTVGAILSSTLVDYYVKDAVVVLDGAAVSASTVINLTGNPASQGITTSSTLAFGTAYSSTYTVDAVATSSVTLTTAIPSSLSSGTTVWISQTATFADYVGIDIDTFSATKALSTALGGYRLYYSSSVTGDADPGTLLATITTNSATVSTDGFTRYTLNTTSHTWDGTRFYFSLSAIDDQVPANESLYDTSPWVITNPGQASITTATLSGTDLTITYLNITATGTVVSGAQNNINLRDAMGGASMTQYSINGGYDVYLVDYVALTGGSYSGIDAASGLYVNSTLAVGDVVVVIDKALQARWVAHCVTAGQVTLNANTQDYGSVPSTYLGTGAPTAANISAKYARVTDRSTDSVLPLDGSGNKQYLTDFQSTHVVTLTAGTDQAVLIESIDTTAGSGKE